MKRPSDFVFLDGYTCFRPTGNVTFEEAVEIIADAISQCADKGVQRLMVDATGLTGFDSPTDEQRHSMVDRWARAARGLQLSLVVGPEYIHPLLVGIRAARERGFLIDVFTSEPDAIAWLLSTAKDAG